MILSSEKNERLKRLKRLSSQKKARLTERAFVIEGEKVILEAISSGMKIEQIFVSADEHSELEYSVRDFITDCEAKEIEVAYVDTKLFKNSVSTETPQGIACIAAMPDNGWAFLDAGKTGHFLVLVDVRDPGNLGTLIRTAEASGAKGVVLAGTCAELFNPKVVRAAAGALFRLPIVVETNSMVAIWKFVEKEIPALATVVDSDASSYLEADLKGAAIVLGNEAKGLSKEIVEACSQKITIPSPGPTESLNVAMAGAILCFESLRQSGL